MQDKTIRELGAVMKIYVELHRHNVILEVFNEHVSNSPKDAWQTVLLETFDEHFVINSY